MQVACPTCRKKIEWSQDEKWRPFCSERCRLIDLGDWFNEQHRLPAGDNSEIPEESDS